MVSLSQTPWSGYTTTWGTASTQYMACRTVYNSIFGELTWAVNGGLGGYNFQFLVNAFATPGRTWAKWAISESKIEWDPQDGHSHAGSVRGVFGTDHIEKKNLDPRSARVVWTALDGSPFERLSTGMMVLGGVRTFSITPGALEEGVGPADVTSGVTTGTFLVFYSDALYNLSTMPWAPGAQPIVLANFLVPVVTIAGFPQSPVFSQWGRWGIEQIPIGSLDGSWVTSKASPGFFIWFRSFSLHSLQTAAAYTVNVAIPWLAFGPSREKVVSWG